MCKKEMLKSIKVIQPSPFDGWQSQSEVKAMQLYMVLYTLCKSYSTKIANKKKLWVIDKWKPQISTKVSDQMKGFVFPKLYRYRLAWIGRDFKEYQAPTSVTGTLPLDWVNPSSTQPSLGTFGVALVIKRQTREEEKNFWKDKNTLILVWAECYWWFYMFCFSNNRNEIGKAMARL